LVCPRVGEVRAKIHQLLKRRSKFSRQAAGRATSEQVIATNVDTAFLVTALNRDFNPRRIERYVALAWESGARPVVLLNKSDLVDDPLPLLWQAEAAAPGVAVHLVSAATGTGLEALARYLTPGQTIVLLGSSGVGKSTLINRLAGRELQRVSAISDSRDRGRHTTSSRQMIPLDAGGLLIDTPGLRELQLWEASSGLGQTFEDIAVFAAACRFRDCTHQSEPGCAVLAAVEAGALAIERLESFRKLERELAFQHRKQDAAARAEENRRWRAIHKAQRAFYKRP
jgi:ribosome biogenesis GTPase